jgi:alpha-beta hydrolase superfamily lysophospholipase
LAKKIILIHGAFHTGQCWELLAPVLKRRGFEVDAPTLPGQRGNPRNPLLVTMADYTSAVTQRADAIGGPVILLGHSMGGFIVSAAAERTPALFSSLIYLTAAVPPLGRSRTCASSRRPATSPPRRPAMGSGR